MVGLGPAWAGCLQREVERTGLPSGDEGLSAELPGSTTARGQGWPGVAEDLGQGLGSSEDTVIGESLAPRPNSGPSSIANSAVWLEQIINPLWASAATSV